MRSTEHAATVDFVERSLHADLRLEHVAAHVGYSPYHLHRSFRRAFGLTLHTYVRRRRLTEAARALVDTSDPVLDIALRHGFRGQQSFTSAFSAGYGVPPATWRRTRPFFPLLLPYRFPASEWELGRTTGGFGITDRASVDLLLPLSLAAVDMLPTLDVDQHAADLSTRFDSHQVLVARDEGPGGRGAAAVIIDPATGHIDYLAVHPLARATSALPALLRTARAHHPRLSVTTFREGDKADLGHRRTLTALGFRPGRLRVEFGYPTQLLRLDASGAPL